MVKGSTLSFLVSFLERRERQTMCYLNSYMKMFLLPGEGGERRGNTVRGSRPIC